MRGTCLVTVVTFYVSLYVYLWPVFSHVPELRFPPFFLLMSLDIISNNDAKEYDDGSERRVPLAAKLAKHFRKPSCGGLDGGGNTPAVAPDQRYPNDICRLY